MSNIPSERDSFGSRFGVIAATAGSAIGLGNIWRFPYVAGENGGAAFLIIYLGFVLLIGIPVMLSEFTIGRSAQRNVFGSFRKLAPGRPWYLIGIMGVVAAFMILAFYTAVAGWTLEYIFQSIINGFEGLSSGQLNDMYFSFIGSPWRPLLWFFVFMSFTALIIMSGVQKGIEKYTKILMPVLLLLLIVLVVRAVTLPGASGGISFLFKPDFSKITTSTILEALGQAFFSLSIGMGTLVTYGSYIQKKDNLGSTAVSVAFADTFIAILAGLAIFPAVFAFNIEPGSGEGLVYITLPNIFQQMPGGYFFSLMFFILLGVAALTSTISVLEVIVAFFVEELRLGRKAATLLATSSVSILGVMCVLSTSSMADVKLFGFTVFGLMNFTSANILLPLGGFFIVIFVAWYYGREKAGNELSNGGKLKTRYLPFYMFVIKYMAPLAIAFIFLQGVGLIKLS
ncbi:sodium-dependent transporter [Mariniphaga sediminis]|jgi:NSS family neurotransmitter:Na+ symporter|uniref:Transporter n=1 Tax=Mariniphaga sediminis TaxID=1628158 RepID=A0A399D3F6_9BACT|nr:sodium-dependent transporter [Mariniphaga sediminis]RIH66087.1 sodium-dependent transporter [Mariniphaga sediminis]